MYNNAATQIASTENTINSDGSLPALQKDALLMTGSVYRYSGAYWGTYILQKGTTIFGIKIKWKSFFIHDASGAIAGAIGGAFAGGLHGAIVGGLGGGIGSSVAYLFTGN
jgi:outer membrane lipoprotein SlyB